MKKEGAHVAAGMKKEAAHVASGMKNKGAHVASGLKKEGEKQFVNGIKKEGEKQFASGIKKEGEKQFASGIKKEGMKNGHNVGSKSAKNVAEEGVHGSTQKVPKGATESSEPFKRKDLGNGLIHMKQANKGPTHLVPKSGSTVKKSGFITLVGLTLAGMREMNMMRHKEHTGDKNKKDSNAWKPKKVFTEKKLKKMLTKEQYRVTQERGTEDPGTGIYDQFYDKGIYNCVVCKTNLFKSEMKYKSDCGWPTFYDGLSENMVGFKDTSNDTVRIEVRCKTCGSHMGQVFGDGPEDKGGLRYCINSASLKFIK